MANIIPPSIITANIIPYIGASGYFSLLAPFDTKINQEEQYTTKAIRTISDYISNNEDIKGTIYDANGITSTIYDQHVKDDIEIVSLQSDLGHWLYIPSPYISKYPDPNGIIYRTLMLGISLPPLPVDLDLSFLHTDVSNLVIDSLGVTPVIKQVETSKPVLISEVIDIQHTAARNALSNGRTTDRAKVLKLQLDLQQALNKITELETYISTHYVP